MHGRLLIGKRLPDPILFSGVTAGWWKSRFATCQTKRCGIFMVACLIVDFHSWLNLLIAVFVPFQLLLDPTR